MNNDVIDLIVAKQSFDQLNKLVAGIQTADKEFLKLSSTVNSFSKSGFKLKGPKDFVQHTKKANEVSGYLTETIKQQAKAEQTLVRELVKKEQAASATNKAIIKQRYETQQINKQLKEEAVLSSKLSTFYQKQNVILNRLTRRRQDLLLKQKLGIDLDKKEVAELNRLTRAQSRLDRAFKATDEAVGRNQRSVGRYQNALRGLRGVVIGLVGAFGLIEGVRQSFNFTKEAIALAREAKGVEFAFKRLGDTGVDAFQRVKTATRGLISDLDIKTALVDFDNFNLSLEQSDILFEFLAVRAAQTGKSIEELQSSLVEGLSKESKLRIDNLGIATADLNAELEKTPDFLEAVANIARREVAEAGDILDEAANGGEALAASFANAKLNFGRLFEGNSTGLLKLFAKQIDRISAGLSNLKVAFATISQGFRDFITPIVELIQKIPLVNRLFNGTISVLSKFKDALSTPGLNVFADFLRRVGANLSGLGAALSEAKDQVKEFVQSLSAIGEIRFNAFGLPTPSSVKSAFDKIKGVFIEGGYSVAQAYREAYSNAMKPVAEETAEVFKDAEEEVEQSGERVREKLISIFKRIEDSAIRLKAQLGDLFVEGKITNEEYLQRLKDVDQAINDITEGIDAVPTIENPLDGLSGTLIPPSFMLSIQEVENALVNLPWEDSLQIATNFFNEIGNLASTLFAGNIQRIDDEINKNDEKYAKLLENEELSIQQREALEAEQEVKRLEFEKKKREEQKKQAIIQKAFNASQVITNTAVAISKTLAETGVFGIPLTAIVAAQGALQLATVLAQPIPQFAKGKEESDPYTGLMIWGEKQPEVRVSKRGEVDIAKKPTLGFTEKGDTIYPSVSAFEKDVMNQAVILNTISQGERVIQAMMSIKQTDINSQISKEIKKGFAGLKPHRPEAPNYKRLAKEMWLNRYANQA